MTGFPQPLLLPRPGGWRSALWHAPTAPLRALVVAVHPFAEEMNKSRRMAAWQSRALASRGFSVLQHDLHGCGDSAGDSGDADWDTWVEDTVAACRWLRDRHPGNDVPLWLWGQRAGALVAVQAAQRIGEPCHFLFWQPAGSGKPLLQQFLRLKAAAQLGSGGDGKGVTAALKARLAAGQPVDVAGYRLSPGLARGLEAARLTPPTAAGAAGRAVFLEISAQSEPSPAIGSAIADWTHAGWQVAAGCVAGPPFWQTTEIEDAPALIDATVERLCDAAPAPGAPVADAAPSAEAAAPRGAAEQPLVLRCAGDPLLAVLHRPAATPGDPSRRGRTAVVVVVGGPQYRVGSHRQFVMLARHLAGAGHPVLRFDVRGMGDSAGAQRGFEHLAEDIGAAVDAVCREVPAVERVVLWGLCDGASAALMYCHARRDARIAGLCLANPWARSTQSHAAARVRHHYAGRLRSAEFWRKLLTGGVSARAPLEFLRSVVAARRGRARNTAAPATFQDAMLAGWQAHRGAKLLLLSADDFTASEFMAYVGQHPGWQQALHDPALRQLTIDGADHTLSDDAALQAAHAATAAWLGDVAG